MGEAQRRTREHLNPVVGESGQKSKQECLLLIGNLTDKLLAHAWRNLKIGFTESEGIDYCGKHHPQE